MVKKKRRDKGPRRKPVSSKHFLAAEELDIDEIKEILKRANLSDEDRNKLESVLDTLLFLTQELGKNKVSVERLKRMLFGAITETTRKIKKNTEKKKGEKPDEKPEAEKKKPKGHGRNGAKKFTGAETIKVPHEEFKPKDPCPHCAKGKLYTNMEPERLVRLRGFAPVGGKVYEIEKLRCNLCGDILLMNDRKDSEDDPGGKPPGRTGVFTSGIVSLVNGYKIALFFTGRNHAGENLLKVLKQRQVGLDPPIQMCDALSRNMSEDLKTIVANCVAHARRRFVDVAEIFPDECLFVLDLLKKVYTNDATAREQGMTPEERLRFHQEHSQPWMDKLAVWCEEQFDKRKVEPNSSLGEAITYLRKHWEKLTLFLRQPGAPLDNNICERAIKKAILHRKNAYFYKTENGARVGDLFMSLIHTCELCGANPFDYLTKLQNHADELAAAPQNWMPWNYKETMALPGTLDT